MKFLLQLKIASECGMLIPTTLCSNNLEEIGLFLLRHEASGVIYKPLNMPLFTKIMDLDSINNAFFQKAPHIFQQNLQKKYTLRVLCFGDSFMATKMQMIADGPMMIQSITLPDGLGGKIQAFMQQLGIVFGMFDFGVTAEDECVFLALVKAER